MAEANQRLYIELDAGLLLGVVMIKETARQAEARVVDQKIDLHSLFGQLSIDVVDGPGIGEIRCDHVALHAILGGKPSQGSATHLWSGRPGPDRRDAWPVLRQMSPPIPWMPP